MEIRTLKLRVIVVLSLIEVILFSGLPFGWGSLVFVLKEEGIYSYLCAAETNQTFVNNLTINKLIPLNKSESQYDTDVKRISTHLVSCPEQNDRLNLLFSIAVAVLTIFDFSAGLVNQRFGNTVSRVAFIVCFVIGALFVAFTSIDVPWLILPGLILTGIGGFALVITNIRVTLFLSSGSSIYIGFLNGCYDSSASVQMIVKLLFENGISRRYTYIGIIVLHILISSVVTFLHYVMDENEGKTFELELKQPMKNKEINSDSIINEDISKETDGALNGEINDKQIEDFSIKDIFISTKFIFHLAWMCILVLRFYYFVGSINAHLERNLETNEEVGYFTNVLAYVMFCGLISSIIAGVFCEWQKSCFIGMNSELKRKLMPIVIPLALCSCLNIILSGLAFSKISVLLYLTFIVMVCHRSFMYCVNMQYFVSIFPAKYSTLVFGVELSLAGCFSMLQYALFVWGEAYPGAINHVNVLLLCLGCLSLLHPVNVFIQSRRHSSEYIDHS